MDHEAKGWEKRTSMGERKGNKVSRDHTGYQVIPGKGI